MILKGKNLIFKVKKSILYIFLLIYEFIFSELLIFIQNI